MNQWFLTDGTGNSLATLFHVNPVITVGVLTALAIWSLVWKGFALWHAARNHQKKWFIIILVVNTIGILEIVYLVWFRRDKREGVTQSMFNNPLPDEPDDEVSGASA